MKGKPKTTTQRIYLEDFERVKKFQELNQIPTFAEAFHRYVEHFERELEEARDRIREVEAKWAEVSEENLELRAKLNKSFWQRLKGFLRL